MAKQQHGGHEPIKGWGVSKKTVNQLSKAGIPKKVKLTGGEKAGIKAMKQAEAYYPSDPSTRIQKAKESPKVAKRIMAIDERKRNGEYVSNINKTESNPDRYGATRTASYPPEEIAKMKRNNALSENTVGLTNNLLKKNKK